MISATENEYHYGCVYMFYIESTRNREHPTYIKQTNVCINCVLAETFHSIRTSATSTKKNIFHLFMMLIWINVRFNEFNFCRTQSLSHSGSLSCSRRRFLWLLFSVCGQFPTHLESICVQWFRRLFSLNACFIDNTLDIVCYFNASPNDKNKRCHIN